MTRIGYTTSDALANKAFGYRSHNVAMKGVGQLLAGSEISYNGFVFPPTVRAKATIVPEYNKARTAVKWIQVVITVEAYITPYETVSAGGTGYSTNTVDYHMDQIKARLEESCQPLSFNLQGFGKFNIGTDIYDVNFGPTPQVIEWEPITGASCVRIEWLVATCIPICRDTQNGLQGILDLWYEANWSLGDAGILTRTINGGMEVALTRPPDASSMHANNNINLSAVKAQYDQALEKVRTAFPTALGFTREESFRVSANKKLLNFTLTDTEIPSGQAYPQGVVKADITESLSSSFNPGAFTKWEWGFSGTITVANSKVQTDIVNNKRLAYFFFGVIVKERLARTKDKFWTLPLPDFTSDSAGNGEKSQKVATIPVKISISNEIYGASISVDLRFVLFCSPTMLFQATGMFDRVRSNELTWQKWRDSIDKGGSHIPYIDVLPSQEMIVDLCHPLVTLSPGDDANQKDSSFTNSDNSIFTPVAPTEESSWVPPYTNKFIFETRYFTSASAPLDQSAAPVNAQAATPNQASAERELFPLPGGVYAKSITEASSQPTLFVTMYGRAKRIGFPINSPELQSVGGSPAQKYGKDLVIPTNQPSGFIDKDGKPVPIYSLQWKKTYIIANLSADQKALKTSGVPAAFAP